MSPLAHACLCLAGLSGCAYPPLPSTITNGTIYQGTVDPVQYRSPLPRDVHASPTARATRPAHGESCRTLLSFPSIPPTPFYGSDTASQLIPWQSFAIVWGDESYASAVERARESVDGAPIYDVRADLHTMAVLGVLRRECVEVHAAIAPPVAPTPRR